MPANRLAAVGAFVVFGVLLFAVGLFLIGDRRMLFSDNFELYAEFSRIAGLQNGATVRVAGMDAGEVEEIRVPAGPSARFRVRMRVRSDLRQLIRQDSVASIQNDGLVGNKFVQIETGSDQSPVVADEGTIRSTEPFDIADVMKSMAETVAIVNSAINDVKGQLDIALRAVSETARDAQTLIDDVGEDARAIMASTQTLTRNVNAVVAGVREGRGTVGKLLTDDAFYLTAKRIAADAEKAVATLREAGEQARGAIADVRGDLAGDGGPVKGLTGSLQQTLASARDAMQDLAENTEALKRNFFFRGFFNRRGYFDLDDVSVAEYRQGALETDDRRVLRIWARAGVLFEKDANGREQLTDDGKARLDSAMATFVQYPRTSPFVVEGYAREITADERFLLSRWRAQLVRDYIVGKFGLDSNYVAVMPMGSEAPGSPDGDRWDGVALALFVAPARS
jgi:phospholipid/cholesterol/gamma-HCH transport system substrate-binding protein